MKARQGEYGEYLASEKIADVAIPFNRVVKYGTTTENIALCGSADRPVGVAEFDPRRKNKDDSVRTGWVQYESLAVKVSGIAVITASGIINAKAEVVPDANGKVQSYTRQTVSSSPAKSEIEAIAKEDFMIVGVALDAAAQDGDLIRVQLSIKG